jgi:predicted ArsR family transcriptional regulator
MRPRKTEAPRAATHAYGGLDRALHEKSRLSIVVALLSRPEGATFPELKRLCALTDGNLNRHLAVLQEAAIVEVKKSSGDGRPTTVVRLGAEGRREFLAYLDELERVVRDARGAAKGAKARGGFSEGGRAPA